VPVVVVVQAPAARFHHSGVAGPLRGLANGLLSLLEVGVLALVFVVVGALLSVLIAFVLERLVLRLDLEGEKGALYGVRRGQRRLCSGLGRGGKYTCISLVQSSASRSISIAHIS
jgi:hypothetical protein